MGFDMKSWSNPIALDSNNLNRIEHGIKNAHDTIEIANEEISNLQHKHLELVKELKAVTKDAPEILNTLSSLNSLLENNELSALLSNMDSFLLKTKQTLTDLEISQVYENLRLNSFLKLTAIKVNGVDVVKGSKVNIELPTVDTALNINSENAISNKAVAKALQNIDIAVDIPDKLSDLKQDTEHQTVTLAEKIKWNSLQNISVNVTETDPTVPAWAKEPIKPFYSYNEILDTPNIPNNTNQLINGAGYITEVKASNLIATNLNTFQTNNIIPINNKLNTLETSNEMVLTLVQSKAPINHTHDEYAEAYHDHSNVYALLYHTHDEYKTYTDTAIANLIGAAPDAMNTLKELADAIETNKDILNTLNNTYLKLSGGILTGDVTINSASKLINLGTAADTPIITRGIRGANIDGTAGDLYLQHSQSYKVYFGSSANSSLNSDGTITEAGSLLSNKYAPKTHTHSYSAVYTGTSATKANNTTLSTLRIGFVNNNLYIWNS